MSSLDIFQIEVATVDLARAFESEGTFDPPRTSAELTREVLLALVSSRIRWEIACGIVADLLPVAAGATRQRECELRQAVGAAVARHRHPQRIAGWVEALLGENARMLNRVMQMLRTQQDPVVLRRWLSAEVAGIGPKQASMLLRNLGRGKRLAILDRHVLRFMHLLGISATSGPISGVVEYESREASFVEYADHRGISADSLDVAVWVVMRTATKRGFNEHRDAGFRGA